MITWNTLPNNRAELAKRFFHGEGVELGVAAGGYSEEILKVSDCRRLWSIDRWSDHHGAPEYLAASARLANAGGGRCVPLRMSFEEAAPLFDDGSLDFVYVDGYAHTGQEGGKTLEQWWPKVKPGGVFSGHDYHERWPATVEAVNVFATKHELMVELAGGDEYPSWWVVKPGDAPVTWDAPKLMTGSPVKPGESVILVGNGPSMMLRGRRGAWIDSFDQVVRFNTYAIEGFENQVGTKTTLWSTFGRGSKPRDVGERPQRAVYVHGEEVKRFEFPVAEAWGIPRAFFDEVRERLKARSKVPVEERKKALLPSSGLVVALWLLEVHKVPEVMLIGFDHFSKEESGGHHYWLKRSFKKPPEHDGEAEAGWVAELVKAGKVKRC